MARTSSRLPTRFPVGSAYVVEARGSVQGMTLMHRYVRFPDGRKVELTARLVPASGKDKTLTIKAPRRRLGRAASAADHVG